MRIIIVGAGLMGLATAWALVRAGHRPVLYERGPAPNPLASSFDRHRVIRYGYGPMHFYAVMVREAFEAWDELWGDLGERHYVEAGQLATGPADDPWLAASRRSLEMLGEPVEELCGAALAARFPMIEPERTPHAWFTPHAGALLADRIVTGLTRHLVEKGVAIEGNREVVGLDQERGIVRFADGSHDQGDRVLVSAGVWIGRLLPELAPRLRPSRQVVVYVDPPADLDPAWRQGPVLTDVDSRAGSIFYTLPAVAGAGLKFGDHRFTLGGDPDEDRTPRPDEVAEVMALAGRRLRAPERYRVAEAKSCFYTVTEDERFVGELQGRTLVLSACSGHGFKFGAAIGRRTAKALTGDLDIAAFRTWLAAKG
ncbi:FAD-dependent oxidoreductase [Geminicoccaceae bacterium 1502E]|nr:FAD-dependent oxidoreductase [Geminicoccaceae bacterium 1502E]